VAEAVEAAAAEAGAAEVLVGAVGVCRTRRREPFGSSSRCALPAAVNNEAGNHSYLPTRKKKNERAKQL
jgi:hypothetical protein